MTVTRTRIGEALLVKTEEEEDGKNIKNGRSVEGK